MTGTAQISSAKAFEQFTDHPLFKYRQCAPDVDDPTRAAGNPALSRNAWIMEDRDGAEPQKEREAREAACIDVCVSCPVMVLCDVYANSIRLDGRLAEPRGIWGGRTARERLAMFKARRHEVVAAPKRVVLTAQKRAVLFALALSSDPVEVSRAAGLDLRTTNWQRSRLVTELNVGDGSSRMQLLQAAVELGLLEASLVVADDGTVPAVPPPPTPTPAAVPSAPAPASVVKPVQLSLWQSGPVPVESPSCNEPMEAAA